MTVIAKVKIPTGRRRHTCHHLLPATTFTKPRCVTVVAKVQIPTSHHPLLATTVTKPCFVTVIAKVQKFDGGAAGAYLPPPLQQLSQNLVSPQLLRKSNNSTQGRRRAYLPPGLATTVTKPGFVTVIAKVQNFDGGAAACLPPAPPCNNCHETSFRDSYCESPKISTEGRRRAYHRPPPCNNCHETLFRDSYCESPKFPQRGGGVPTASPPLQQLSRNLVS